MTPHIVVDKLERFFRTPDGEALSVLADISFEVRRGGLVSILGPSGCGKSTLLNLLSGLDVPSSGVVRIEGKSSVGFVFQAPRLLEWRTVRKNIELPLEPMGLSAEERKRRVEHFVELTGLRGFEDYYPHQISGGMQQRVAMARALAIEPDILLMDEPFSGLDAITAERLRVELIRIWQETEKTILFVTHDISEAAFVSERVLLLTPKPARIHASIDVDLPYPRSVDDKGVFEHDREIRRQFFTLLD